MFTKQHKLCFSSRSGHKKRLKARQTTLTKFNLIFCPQSMYASMQKNTEAVYQLLENGADINMKTDTGKTALMYANSQGQMEVVYILLRAYAFQSGDTVNEENFNTNCIDIDKEITYDDIIEGETTINIRKYLQDKFSKVSPNTLLCPENKN